MTPYMQNSLPATTSVARHFAKAADTYAVQPGIQAAVAEKVAARLQEERTDINTSILEAGCGTGYLTKALCRLFPAARIVAVDIAEKMLAEARKQFTGYHKNLEFLRADIGKASLSEQFSLVVSSSALHWMTPLYSTFNNLKRCLRNDGRIVFAMMVDGTLGELQSLRREIAPSKTPPRKLPTVNEVIEAMRENNLTVSYRQTESLTMTYPSPGKFLETIQNQGVTGGFSTSDTLLTRSEIRRLAEEYRRRYTQSDGQITATYSILYLEGYSA